MILKQPLVVDVSHWKIVPDFSLVRPRPVLVFTKATECYPGTPFGSIVDPTFARYFADMKRAGLARGAYHFHRKNYNSLEQAKHFVNTVRLHCTPVDILALDLEEGGESAAQIIQWLDYVQSQFPNNLIMIYGRKALLDPIPMSATQAARLKKVPIWVAGYPYFPDLWNSPTGYIPDQGKWGPVWLWQYSDKGIIEGISGSTDCNWISPAFYEMIKNIGGEPTPPPEPEVSMQGKIKSATNIRNSTPGGSYQDIGDMVAGDVITSDVSALIAGVKWYHLTNATRNGQPIVTLGGLNVSQRADCWAYGPNIEPIPGDGAGGEPEPPAGLPVLNVTVSGEGYQEVRVELKPK